MNDEQEQARLTSVRPIHESLLTRFWPAFVACVDDLVKAGDLDCRFGFETRCGNAGGCDPEALSRAVQQHLGRFGWPIANPSTLRPREILDLVEFVFTYVACPAWDICGFCEQRHIVGGNEVVAQENYTCVINNLFRRFNQPFTLQRGRVGDSSTVTLPVLVSATQSVKAALDDADLLIRSHGAPRAVDRVHTALHGYLRAACDTDDVPLGTDTNLSVTQLFKRLRERHRAFRDPGTQQAEVEKVLKALSSAVDALNPIRNQASMAHPGGLLGDAEAILVINAARAIFVYLDAKLADGILRAGGP